MDENKQVVNADAAVEVTTEPESTPDEPNQEEEVISDSEDTEATADVETDDTDDDYSPEELGVKSKKGNTRIRELAARAKRADELEAEILQLRDRLGDSGLGSLNGTSLDEPETDNRLPWEQEQVVTVEDYEKQVSERASQIARREAVRMLDLDKQISQVRMKHVALNPTSESYDAGLEEYMTDLYKAKTAVDPKVKLTDFVEDYMKRQTKIVNNSKAETTVKMAEEASRQAVAPTTSADPKKSFSEMSLTEMEETLGFTD